MRPGPIWRGEPGTSTVPPPEPRPAFPEPEGAAEASTVSPSERGEWAPTPAPGRGAPHLTQPPRKESRAVLLFAVGVLLASLVGLALVMME